MRIAICSGLILTSILLAPGCRLKKAETTDPKVLAADADKEYEQILAGKHEDGDKAMEAREYLSPNQTANGLWKTSRSQTLEWVNELYKAGAAKVYAVYSPADDTIRVNMCASLLVALPTAPDARAKVLTAYNRISKRLWGEDHTPETDLGQKYLMVEMDT